MHEHNRNHFYSFTLMCWCCVFVLYAALYVYAACLCFMLLYMGFHCMCSALIYCSLHFPMMFMRCILLSAYFIVCLQLSTRSYHALLYLRSHLYCFLIFVLCIHSISVILGCLLNIWLGTTDLN